MQIGIEFILAREFENPPKFNMMYYKGSQIKMTLENICVINNLYLNDKSARDPPMYTSQ